MEIVILNNTIQDLEEIIGITLVIKDSGNQSNHLRIENPSNKDGEITKCNVYGSINLWMKSCPGSYENQMKIKGETNITLIGECIDTLIGETLTMAVLDSGCTKPVSCKTLLNCYLASLSSEVLNNIKRE